MRQSAIVAIGGFVPVGCLNIAEVDSAQDPDGGGSGGTGVADASWDTSATGGIGGGAAGSGGFVAAACTSCGAGGCECVPEVGHGRPTFGSPRASSPSAPAARLVGVRRPVALDRKTRIAMCVRSTHRETHLPELRVARAPRDLM